MATSFMSFVHFEGDNDNDGNADYIEWFWKVTALISLIVSRLSVGLRPPLTMFKDPMPAMSFENVKKILYSSRALLRLSNDRLTFSLVSKLPCPVAWACLVPVKLSRGSWVDLEADRSKGVSIYCQPSELLKHSFGGLQPTNSLAFNVSI